MTTTVMRPMLGGTASMLGDPEAHRSGDASVSCPDLAVPCAGVDLEWVPDVEQPVVPLMQRQLCLRCPARQWCLTTAVATGSHGYWAGTTTAQRRALHQQGGPIDVAAADQAQAKQLPTHLPGQGSLSSYRRDRCRCHECRRYNADAKMLERARSRRTAGAVAA